MKQLTILVVSVNAVGHVNSCANALKSLLARGHRIIFLLEESFREKLSALGYEEFIYTKNENKHDNPGEDWANMLLNLKLMGPDPVLEKHANFARFMDSDMFLQEIKYLHEGVKQVLAAHKFDLVYVDCTTLSPEIYNSGIPWIENHSLAVSFFAVEDDIPPGGSGLSSNGPKDQWGEFYKITEKMVKSKAYSDMWRSLGYEPYPDDLKVPPTQLLTVYAYPDELNFESIRKRTDWFNLEVFDRVVPTKEKIKLEKFVPKEFLNDDLNGNFSGKLCYLSMGSMGSIDVELMKRLVSVLGKTNHKYIVSKGSRHKEYSLPRNMWGDRFLPQTAPGFLERFDLVITHGGNNTVTETFARGIPMCCLPLFVDQYDNAQRLAETGYGARVDPHHFTEEELISTVNRLLFDEQLHKRVKQAAQRIQANPKHDQLADRIEQLLA